MTVNKDNLKFYAYVSADLVEGDIKGVVLTFEGLGFQTMRDTPGTYDLELASKGIITVTPFYGPWSWMNRETVVLVDEIVDAIYDRYQLDASVPLFSTGGSMGGHCALVYCIYTKHPIRACFANCPVCDLPYHATERPDLPRTMYAAFAHYECGIDEALAQTSALHQADKLPRIPYLIIHADGDKAVNYERHSKPLIEKMRALGHEVAAVVTRNDMHCVYNDYEQYRRSVDFIVDQVL